MAWMKVKTAMVVGATLILTLGTATVVVKNMSGPSIRNLAWTDDPRYWEIDFNDADPRAIPKRLKQLPPVFVLRPTRFNENVGSISSGDRILGRNRNLAALIQIAYDESCTHRLVLPDNFPKDGYDLMLTLEKTPREALQKEIKQRFGFVAHRETNEVDVLLLKIKEPGAAGLVTTKGGTPFWSFPNAEKKVEIKNQSLAGIAGCFGSQLKMIVFDRTELSGRYDCSFRWQNRNGETDTDAFKRVVLELFGLEFVLAREAVKRLVVERVKE
jgi:uncharacterized protein (TIGR03435 family)